MKKGRDIYDTHCGAWWDGGIRVLSQLAGFLSRREEKPLRIEVGVYGPAVLDDTRST